LPYQYLHLTRLAVFNTLATAMAIAAYFQGWLDGVFQAYLSQLLGLIFLVFLYGLAHCAVKTWRHGRDLNDIQAGDPNPQSPVGRYVIRAKDVTAAAGATGRRRFACG